MRSRGISSGYLALVSANIMILVAAFIVPEGFGVTLAEAGYGHPVSVK